MTRKEFAERSQVARKREKRFNRIWGIVVFGFLIGNWLYVDIYDPQMPDEFWIICLVVFFAILLANVAFTIFMATKIARDAGLECGICQEPLDKNAAALAVTTGKCAHSSQQFLTD